ncbi:helix-turn-helix domain-containing protein [Bacillus sp. KH172YL63]|uniref:helix-turn-helix domain-containing protein n=1 Tax=Bacillus sp. KH172YL63 TaxID=2709784 RepID=UPI0013E414E6|nr:helix-turn-helix domain-containing protein [Bacillus sp. KH172YL63]BCB02963.1 transcriptional regulator [Bacillus sp. KH172YL63]
MEHFPLQIGENIRRIRRERGFSLEQMAERTGVSKAMIGQIERGDSNPTVAILWKIANGLKVSFSSLIEKPASQVSIIHYEDVQPVLEDDGHYIVYPIFPFDPLKKWESYRVELKHGCAYKNDGHTKGVEEYITVLSGSIRLKIGGETYDLTEGSSIRFAADSGHEYTNDTGEMAVCQMVIYYGGE